MFTPTKERFPLYWISGYPEVYTPRWAISFVVFLEMRAIEIIPTGSRTQVAGFSCEGGFKASLRPQMLNGGNPISYGLN